MIARLALIYGARETVWPGIVQSLLAEGGAIADTLLRCDRMIRTRLGWSLPEMSGREEHTPEHALEPTLTAVQAALTDGWRERGVLPDAVGARCGGEFAAAYARGAITLEDAMEFACRFSREILDGRATGHMLAVRIDLPELKRMQRSSPVDFAIAVDYFHVGTVIACDTCSLAPLQEYLSGRGAAYQLLPPAVAYHSSEIDGWKDALIAPLGGDRPTLPRRPGYSATAGGLLDEQTSSVQHFWRVVREPAIVGPLLERMISDSYDVFLEVGGHPSLEEMIHNRARVSGKTIVSLCSMRRQMSFAQVAKETLAALERAGCVTAARVDHSQP